MPKKLSNITSVKTGKYGSVRQDWNSKGSVHNRQKTKFLISISDDVLSNVLSHYVLSNYLKPELSLLFIVFNAVNGLLHFLMEKIKLLF